MITCTKRAVVLSDTQAVTLDMLYLLLSAARCKADTCWDEDCQYDCTGCLRPHIKLCQFHIIGHLRQTILVTHHLRHMRGCLSGEGKMED